MVWGAELFGMDGAPPPPPEKGDAARRISGYVLWNPVKCGAPGFQRTYTEIRRSLEYILLTPIEGTHVAFSSVRVVFMPILIFRLSLFGNRVKHVRI